jgi:ABC-type Fe3+-hydroxamate transport system substrate-binding protein
VYPRKLLVALATALLSCGVEPPAPGAPPRIVSLSPSITRILLALDAADAIVGVDRYSQRLERVRGKPSLGGLFAPDLERTLELEPSLILAVESAQQSAYLDVMRARGVRVQTFRGHTLADVLTSFARIGELVGKSERGAALAERVGRELAALTAASGHARPSVAIVIESEPLYVVGGGSFVNDLIEAAGGRNAFADQPDPYPRVGLEVLAERAPQVLVDTTFDAAHMEEAQLAARAHWRRFAWIERVEVLPQGILTLPGPDLVEAAHMLRERIQP